MEPNAKYENGRLLCPNCTVEMQPLVYGLYVCSAPPSVRSGEAIFGGLEVKDASCQDFDGFCSSGDCAARVGRMVGLPDPGSLLGG